VHSAASKSRSRNGEGAAQAGASARSQRDEIRKILLTSFLLLKAFHVVDTMIWRIMNLDLPKVNPTG
jgi:hypothetical protein